jgi:hypothetical protein
MSPIILDFKDAGEGRFVSLVQIRRFVDFPMENISRSGGGRAGVAPSQDKPPHGSQLSLFLGLAINISLRPLFGQLASSQIRSRQSG